MLTLGKLKYQEFEEKDLDKESYIPNNKFGELGLELYLHVKMDISYYGMWVYETDEIELILVHPIEGIKREIQNDPGGNEEIKSDGYYGTKKEGSNGN